MPRKLLVAIAVALPLAVLGVGILRAERHLGENRRWAFEIGGYDPRDMLRGHYIQFRIVLNEAPGAPCNDDSSGRCCLCLAADSPESFATTTRMTCEAAFESCEGVLNTKYLDTLRRYYIREERAAELTKLFQDAATEHRAKLIVAIDRTGRPQIDALLIDGVPIEEAKR